MNRHEKVIIIGGILLILGAIGDLWSTHIVLGMGGMEANPFARWMLDDVGFWSLNVLKATGVMLILIITWGHRHEKDAKWLTGMMWAVGVWWSVLTISNLSQAGIV